MGSIIHSRKQHEANAKPPASYARYAYSDCINNNQGKLNMQMNLYQAEIIDASGNSTRHVVALSAEHAGDVIQQHYRTIGERLTRTDIHRIDQDLEGERRAGLDQLLQDGPAGFASYCEAVGWTAHAPASGKLRLFRIEDEQGTQTYVVAPDANIASAIYVCDAPLAKGEQRTIRIGDGLAGLPEECIGNIHSLLETGPIGIARFEEGHGWTVC